MINIIKEVIQKVVEWFIYSSKNPEKFGLTFHSALGFIIIGLGYVGIPITFDLDVVTSSVVQLIGNIGQTVTTITFLWGVTRKIIASIKGKYKI